MLKQMRIQGEQNIRKNDDELEVRAYNERTKPGGSGWRSADRHIRCCIKHTDRWDGILLWIVKMRDGINSVPAGCCGEMERKVF